VATSFSVILEEISHDGCPLEHRYEVRVPHVVSGTSPAFERALGLTSMAQTAWTLMVFSPVATAIGLLAYFFIVQSRTVGRKPDFLAFMSTVAFWAVGALVFAGIVVAVGISAFYDVGNEPFAIFIYGPPALAVGGIAGAISWRKEMVKPDRTVERDARKNTGRHSL